MQRMNTPYYPRTANDIILGDWVEDRISGCNGIAMCRAEYLTGCTQIGIMLTGTTDDGKPRDWVYFDWQRLAVICRETHLADIQTSAATLQRNGAGEAPPQPAAGLRHS